MPARLLVLLLFALRAEVSAVTLVALGEDGALFVFASERSETVRRVEVSGVGGRLIGIDTRPADGRLYGLTAGNDLCRIDPRTGAATVVGTLTVPSASTSTPRPTGSAW